MIKVLLIVASFAPNNTSGSIPNTKLIKYLARLDMDITLITDAITEDMALDESLVPKEADRIRILRVEHSGLYHKTIGHTRQKITDSGLKNKMKAERRPLRERVVSEIKYNFFRVRDLDWLRDAKRVIRDQLKGEVFDVVYSTYPIYYDHLLAEYVMKKKLARKWVADFRDPIAYMIFDSFHYRDRIRRQHRVERLADLVTIVSEGAMDKFRFPDVPVSKLCYIPNGYDPEELPAIRPTEQNSEAQLRFFYAGTLYAGKRDLSVVFRAISELAAGGEIDPDRISFEYAGNEWETLLGFAEKYGCQNICRNYGYIPNHRVLEIMSTVDATVVCTHNSTEDGGIVTGKVFELLLVGKPILTVISGNLPGSELGAIIQECNAGIVYEEVNAQRDYPVLKQWLLDAYREKMEKGSVCSHLIEAKREQYSYATIARKLFETFESVMK